MVRTPSRHPTDLELEVLKVLWRRGPFPARAVRDALAEGDAGGGAAAGRDLAVTSVVTVLNIMVRKGYLRRSRPEGVYVYAPRSSRRDVQGHLLRDLVERVFDGSAAAMVLGLLETADLDPREIESLRRLIRRKTKEAPP